MRKRSAAVAAFNPCTGIHGSTVVAFDRLDSACGKCADDLPGSPATACFQVGAALRALSGSSRIARSAKSAVDIRTRFGLFDLLGVCQQFLLAALMKGDILWLRRAAGGAIRMGSQILTTAIWAAPVKLDIAFNFADHVSPYGVGVSLGGIGVAEGGATVSVRVSLGSGVSDGSSVSVGTAVGTRVFVGAGVFVGTAVGAGRSL